jgi:hypothetical protein
LDIPDWHNQENLIGEYMAADPTGVQVTGAMIIVWFIQELKKSKYFPAVTIDTVKVNRVLGAIGALLTGAAIHWVWDPVAHSLLITGITASAVASFTWSFLQQFVGQEMLYQFLYASKETIIQATASAARAQAATVHVAAGQVVDAIKHPDE